jgi:hypothetical protein
MDWQQREREQAARYLREQQRSDQLRHEQRQIANRIAADRHAQDIREYKERVQQRYDETKKRSEDFAAMDRYQKRNAPSNAGERHQTSNPGMGSYHDPPVFPYEQSYYQDSSATDRSPAFPEIDRWFDSIVQKHSKALLIVGGVSGVVIAFVSTRDWKATFFSGMIGMVGPFAILYFLRFLVKAIIILFCIALIPALIWAIASIVSWVRSLW